VFPDTQFLIVDQHFAKENEICLSKHATVPSPKRQNSAPGRKVNLKTGKNEQAIGTKNFNRKVFTVFNDMTPAQVLAPL
jgi:hypothetical protein